MLELTMTPSTIILLVIILAAAVLAVRRLVHRGMCDCGDGEASSGRCAHCAKHCGADDGCEAVAAMLSRMESDAESQQKTPSRQGGVKLMAPTPFAR